MRRVIANNVGDLVQFDNSYRDPASLNLLISSADVVVLPYDSKDQATSGVLVDAVAAGRPVVSTAFPHAEELLATGAGITVPHQDSVSLARALRRVLTEPALATAMADESRVLASGLSWRAVAAQFQGVTRRLLQYADVPA
jgi:glycosyltransferase involved in cell wall biosynthesis